MHGSNSHDPDPPFRPGYISISWDPVFPIAASLPPEPRPPSPLRTGIIVAAMIAAAAWTALGDDRGQRFHVANSTGEDHDIALAFPSGERREFHLGAGASAGFRVVVLVVGGGRTAFYRILPEDGE